MLAVAVGVTSMPGWSRRKSSNPITRVGGFRHLTAWAVEIWVSEPNSGMEKTMQHYITRFTAPRKTSEKYISPVVACGGCSTEHFIREVPVVEAYRIRVPEDWGAMGFDPRKKTPTGGRFGLPGDPAFRRFRRTKTVFGCLSCALKFPIVERPRDARFAERCKKR